MDTRVYLGSQNVDYSTVHIAETTLLHVLV